MRRVHIHVIVSLAAALAARAARAAETCGDQVDNDGDNLADEGCNPTGTTGVCESPLACSRAGSIAPISGQLVLPVEPDVAPHVAYGPGIPFVRTYLSLYDPGYANLGAGAATDYKAPLGYRWHHNYMSWLKLDTAPNPDEAFVHLVTGQDVQFTYASTDGTYNFFTPQPGYHFDYLRQKISTGIWELRTLTGQVYEYNWSSPTGKLVKIKDSVGNFVELTYNADGQIEWVKDASTRKKLKLRYQSTGSKLLQYVDYYTNDGSTDTLRLTVEFAYSSGNQTTVYLDGTIVRLNSYVSDYLSAVYDGNAAKYVALPKYLSGSPGKTVRLETQQGTVGYTYNTQCAGAGTQSLNVTFHYHSTTACDTTFDGTDECGAGYYCGGETNPAANNTGVCFKAKRCLTVNVAGNEDLIDAVSATSCPSCVDTKDYAWDTTNLEVDGRQSADSVWTSYLYNGNGLVTRMVEGDNDAVADNTNPTTARTTYYFYGDTSFPGRVTEVRRLSQFYNNLCDASTSTNCKRTIYAYTTGGRLDTLQEIGFTKDNAGTVTSYSFTTDYNYDSQGRTTEILGPRPSTEDDVEYTYYTTGALDTGHLKEAKRQKDATTYLTTTYAEYDFFGNAGRVTDPNSKSVCLDYHDDYNLLLTRRQVINGSHTDCTQAAGSNDETTTHTYDASRLLTQTKKPRLNCLVYTYDNWERLSTLSVRDNNAGSCATSGDTMAYTYALDGQVTKIEWKDSAGAVKRSQEYTFYSDRRREKTINPVSTSYFRKLYYDDDGVPAKLEFEDFATSEAKVEWDVDDLDRQTAVRKYHSANDHEDFTITQAAQMLGLPLEVVDEASHDIDNEWDDLGRKVTETTEEAGTNRYVYNEAGLVTEKVEADGAAGEQSTTYSYDALGRLTAANNGEAVCFTLGGAEIQYSYDALPSGVSCPTGSNCNLLSGRLAYVKTKLWCDDAKSDDTFDMETFYSYDEAGRVKEHTVQNDTGSSTASRVQYVYDKNSNVTEIIPPAGSTAKAKYTFGWSNASDDDKVTSIERDTTTILSAGVKWLPFGPVDEYSQQNVFWHGGTRYAVKVDFTYNLAYRVTDIQAKSIYSTPDNVLRVDPAEDVRGRYTQRDLSWGTNSQRDMYFLYDDLSRVTCRKTSSTGNCPTSGSTLGENISYNTSADRSSIILRNGVYTDITFTPAYVTSTSDTLDKYTKSGGSNIVDFSHDTLGRRTSDQDDTWGGNPDKDLRSYTYDGRNNVKTIAGEYWTGSAWNTYTITYAYDERNRIYFRSFVDSDATCGGNPCEAQTFYFWDRFDRLIQTKHTPDIATSNTYSIFQWYWLGDLAFLYYQIDYPAATTTRRYLHHDEMGRPLAAWSWPTSGDSARVWEVDPGLFGWDEVTVGASIYQPIRFPGQLYDEDSEAWADDTGAKLKRPGICYNRFRSYDSFTGGFLQVDPLVASTWEPYTYAGHDCVQCADPSGRNANLVIQAEGFA
jgi:RHS repeat-associated protein